MPVPFTKEWHENKKYRDIFEKAVTTFGGQYELLKKTGDVKVSTRAVGYLDGFVKSAMKQQGLEINSRKAFNIFCALYEKIWGFEQGKRHLEHWINVRENESHPELDELDKGIALGVIAFQARKPVGWMSCFDHEDNLKKG